MVVIADNEALSFNARFRGPRWLKGIWMTDRTGNGAIWRDITRRDRKRREQARQDTRVQWCVEFQCSISRPRTAKMNMDDGQDRTGCNRKG